MTGEGLSWEQSAPPPVDINLDELVRQRREGGPGSVDVWEACAAKITPEHILEVERIRYAQPRAKSKVLFDNEGTARISRKLAINKLFLDVFDEGVPGAPDIWSFSDRLHLFMDHTGQDLRHYRTGALATSRLQGKGILEVATRSFEYLQQFCERHPDLEAPAVEAWIKGYAEHDTLGLGSAKTSRFRGSTERSVNQPDLSRSQRQGRRRRVDQITDRLWWQDSTPLNYGGEQTLRSRISGLSHIPFERIGAEELWSLRDILEHEENINPSQLNRFIGDSLRATVSFMRQVAKGDKKLDDHPVGKLVVLAEHQESAGDEPITFQWLIKAANTITPALAAESGLDLDRLDPNSFEDYPKAVDRLISYTLAAGRQSVGLRGQTELFQAAADCIKLVALRTSEQKLDQKVLSLGDIVLRYPDLSAEQQREMMERLQRRGGPAAAVAVRSIYQQVRGTQKRHSRFNRNQPGYGIFS